MSPIGPKIQDRAILKRRPASQPAETDNPTDSLALSSSQAPLKSEEQTAIGEAPLSTPISEVSPILQGNLAPTLLETGGAVESLANTGQTLAEVARDVSKQATEPKIPRRPLTQKPQSATQKLGLFRRLGNAFMRFVGGNTLGKFEVTKNEINKLEPQAQELRTPAQFQAKTAEFKARLANGESLADIRNEAYAVARQAAVVKTGMRPYDVQVLGALAMDGGHIAEMRTGEGKTLTAVLPLYLNALSGKGAHLVTVNDTLAQRDRDNMGPVFEMLGLSCECVLEDMSREQKRAGYEADITYTTDRTLGFDYLRDRTAKRPGSKVQREPYFALIDEVDEVLIDEARTPLIISGLSQKASPDFKVFNDIARDLVPGDDFYVDPERNAVWLTDTGNVWVENQLALQELNGSLSGAKTDSQRRAIEAKIEHREVLGKMVRAEQAALRPVREMKEDKPGFFERLAGADFDKDGFEKLKAGHAKLESARQKHEQGASPYNLYAQQNLHRTRYLNAALRAHHTLVKDQDYIVSEDGVHIVDENKGRTSEGRRYNDGIHQALEAKEGVKIQDEQRTVATITYPNLFKKYPRLAGMSGTAKTSEHEFVELYNLDVVSVPTNEPVIRQDLGDIVFPTLQDKYAAVAGDASQDFFEGRPVLIGTLSVEHNRYMAQALQNAGVPPEAIQILNAESVRGDKKAENEIISGAGRSGVITVATNMAGRGANIKPDLVNFQQLSLDVFKVAESGEAVAVQLNDKKAADWLAQWLSDLNPTIVPSENEGGPVTLKVGSGKTQVLKGSDYPTGGLTVYGTARGESARVDDQLIGRAGRQGDPGRSRFYLSLEDDLFAHLGPDTLQDLAGEIKEAGGSMTGTGVADSVKHAQAISESNAFASREKTTKNDKVLNQQREAYFGFRDDLLTSGPEIRRHFGDLVGDSINDVMFDTLPDKKNFTYAEIRTAAMETAKELKIPMGLGFLDPKLGHPDDTKMKAKVLETEVQTFAEELTGWTLDRMKFTTPNVDEALRKELLAIADVSWSEHLESMETLEESVQWQTLAQKDPEVEFSLQGFDLFQDTLGTLRHRTTGIFLPHLVASARQIDQQLQRAE